MKIKTLVGITLAISLFAPVSTFAQTTGSNNSASAQAAAAAGQNIGTNVPTPTTNINNLQGSDLSSLQVQLQALLAQVAALQAQIKAAQTGQGYCHDFQKNLGVGSQGDEVRNLQSTLKKEGLDIPNNEIQNGQYGEGTAAAVSGFQEKNRGDVLDPNGLKYGTGFAGNSTRNRLNKLYGCGGTVPPVQPPQPPSENHGLYVSQVIPSSGPVGAQVTISGRGFTATDNTVNFGYGAIKGLPATYAGTNNYPASGSDDNLGKNIYSFITFTVPSSLSPACLSVDSSVPARCTLLTQLVTPGVYPVSVTNANGTSNPVKFMVTDTTGGGTATSTPTIYGVSGPTTLRAGQQATWMVKADDSANGVLSYSVVWGDEATGAGGTSSSASPTVIPQLATFTHVYSTAGTYSPKFTVTNSAGASAQTSLSVVVSAVTTTTQPAISSLTPTSGPIGTSVYINGTGFTPTDNTVNFGYGVIPGLTSATWMAGTANISSNPISGQTIIFTVPDSLSPACLFSTPRCMIATMLTQPGVYPVSVKNANGASNAANFTVTVTSAPYTPSSTSPTSLNSQGAEQSQTASVSDQLNSMAATLRGMLNSLNR